MIYIETTYDLKTIIQKRSDIAVEFKKQSQNIKNNTIEELSSTDLKILFELYDEIFLNNRLKNEFKGNFKFSLSSRMTRSAGITKYPKNSREIKPEDVIIEFRFGVDFFFQYDLIDRTKKVCGLETNNALEALQLVFEHEICHAIEFIQYHQSSCKGNRFKMIAKSLFGHTSSYHQLPTNKELARERLGLSVGQNVSFQFEGETLCGIINAINKRATVMVPNKKGQYIDKKGNRYVKYYVPLNGIKVKLTYS